MRLLAPLLLLAALAALVYAANAVLSQGRERRQLAAARWRSRHYVETGHTVVAVALTRPDGGVAEEHVIDRIHDGDDEWDRRFLLAREEAEQRAFHLNADRPELP